MNVRFAAGERGEAKWSELAPLEAVPTGTLDQTVDASRELCVVRGVVEDMGSGLCNWDTLA